MITKKLFERVTGYLDDIEDITTQGKRGFKVGYNDYSKNIFELMNLVKVWAINEGYDITSSADGNSSVYEPSVGVFDTYYVDYNEPESVFAAGEAIRLEIKRIANENES